MVFMDFFAVLENGVWEHKIASLIAPEILSLYTEWPLFSGTLFSIKLQKNITLKFN